MDELLATPGRYRYSAITERPRYRWPGGSALALYVAINVECFAYGTGAGATLTPGMDPPNSEHRKYAWRDYGMRVGFWRILEALAEHDLVPCYLLNAYVCRLYPDVVAAIEASGGEVVGHGRTNAELQGGMEEAEEAALIEESTRILTETFGKAPRGWMSPGATQSPRTPDLLREAGYTYTLDWPLDDQPVWMSTRAGPLLSVPYPLEINDLPAQISRGATARDFEAMALDQLEELQAQAAGGTPVVCGLSLHTFVSGQPYRLRALRRVLEAVSAAGPSLWRASPGEIATHAASVLGDGSPEL